MATCSDCCRWINSTVRSTLGHRQQLAVKQLQVALALLVDAEAEGLLVQVDFDAVGQMGVLDRVIHPGRGP